MTQEEKIAYYRMIFKKSSGYAPDEFIVKFMDVIHKKDYGELSSRLWNENKSSRKVFELETGIKLPKTNSGTLAILQDYCKEDYARLLHEEEEKRKEKEEAKRKEKEDYARLLHDELDGFVDGMTDLQKARILKILTNGNYIWRHNEVKCYCVRDFIRTLLERYKLHTKEYTGYYDKKQHYKICFDDNSFHEVNKTAFDYANYMIAKKENEQ